MLLSQNSGKYFSKDYQRDRAEALVDSSTFTAAELEFLEVTATEGGGKNDRHTYEVEIVPVDPETEGRGKFDIRKKGENGGY